MQIDVISLKGLSFRYNSMTVLKEISFSVKAGDYVGLVGPNGSGKSTLIKVLLGLLKAEKGSIFLFGERPEDFRQWQKIGYVPQGIESFNQYFPATVKEIVSLGLIPKRIPMPRDNESLNMALELMDISDIREKLFGELSVGQRQRVLIAKAIINKPEVLILDEPTTALDPEIRERFFSTLMELNQDKKTTIILVTHDIGGIGKYATELLYLDKTIIFYGSFKDFCESPEMEKYFGEHSQHLICHRHV